MRTLEVGQWLGTHNKIVAMQHNVEGWRVEDETGVFYFQSRYADGLFTGNTRDSDKVRTSWPKDTT